MVILDANVISELMRAEPDENVSLWVARRQATDLFTTAVTEAEVLLGIALLKGGRRKALIAERAANMFAVDFVDRILAFDSAAAAVYADIVSARRRAGRPIDVMDAEIAAIALSRSAHLATRNLRDFEDVGLTLHDPWVE